MSMARGGRLDKRTAQKPRATRKTAQPTGSFTPQPMAWHGRGWQTQPLRRCRIGVLSVHARTAEETASDAVSSRENARPCRTAGARPRPR